MVAADVVGHDAGIFQVDGILPHADGEGTDGGLALPGGDGAHQRGVQAAGQQEAHLCVGHQPLLYAGHQLVVDVGAHSLQIIIAELLDLGDIVVADEFAVLVVVSGRKRHHLAAHAHQVLGLTAKDDDALFVIAVVQRADADGVAGGDELLRLAVIEDQSILRVQHSEHVHAIFLVQRQKYLAIGTAAEGIALFQQLGLAFLVAVDLAVADHIAVAQAEGLHPLRRQAHDGQTVKAQQTVAGIHDPAVVGAAGNGLHEAVGKGGDVSAGVTIPNDRTHFVTLRICEVSANTIGRGAVPRGATYLWPLSTASIKALP